MGARIVTVTADQVGQRVDNLMMRLLPGLPRSRIYKEIRKGEVRVNKKRIKAEYKVQLGDAVRLPPLVVAEVPERDQFIAKQIGARLQDAVVFEDANWLVINKPANLAVHAGSSQVAGVIEGLRSARDDIDYLELGHRLDKDTSGCLLMAKNRQALCYFHEALRQHRVKKTYYCLVSGRWTSAAILCKAPLLTSSQDNAKHKTQVDPAGKTAVTDFRIKKRCGAGVLLQAEPKTGRTHQIRVHAAHLGFPLIGDGRYGWRMPSWWGNHARPRLMLHAAELQFTLPDSQRIMRVVSPMPEEFDLCMQHLATIKS
jgi:23S rRNA pseudouridine955/2504/2580 synthase